MSEDLRLIRGKEDKTVCVLRPWQSTNKDKIAVVALSFSHLLIFHDLARTLTFVSNQKGLGSAQWIARSGMV